MEALSSLAYSAGGSGSQRSGAKTSGLWKLAVLWFAAYWGTPTEVCDLCQIFTLYFNRAGELVSYSGRDYMSVNDFDL